jgi:hypothetical protein
MKDKHIVERNLINDIFYKIPEIHIHHELLLSSLKTKFDLWDARQTVGDLFLNIVIFNLDYFVCSIVQVLFFILKFISSLPKNL